MIKLETYSPNKGLIIDMLKCEAEPSKLLQYSLIGLYVFISLKQIAFTTTLWLLRNLFFTPNNYTYFFILRFIYPISNLWWRPVTTFANIIHIQLTFTYARGNYIYTVSYEHICLIILNLSDLKTLFISLLLWPCWLIS